jgi:hypothetical protein
MNAFINPRISMGLDSLLFAQREEKSEGEIIFDQVN